MIDLTLLALFLPTAFFISITPGMCMTLSLTLGLTIGLRRTFWMMWGELVGVGLVAVCAAIGVATIMLEFPSFFTAFKWIGGLYLGWLGFQMWQSRGRMAITLDENTRADVSRSALALQGFVTAIANPKGWAFFATLLPPFLDASKPMTQQLIALVIILLSVEFICLCLYAGGGRSMRHFLEKSGNVKTMNRVAGTLMVGVGIWLAFG
ncbi:LysE family translocator [Terasakiella sp. A23]|uniref:LysE family translocator n=1 Tax=Terasakiella sp. FCG-A23 TaxID=3080561 RepID=UPI002952ED1E|nr:LysE family translocator [Terasakiella sp. A23]MDV7340051.1 LysE family translocator [Terasakiella sp. A23]